MTHATIIGIDLAKNVFHAHDATDDGTPIFRKKLSRRCYHVTFRTLQKQPVSAGSGNIGCGCPSFESFHSVISDSQGGAASG